MTKTTNSTVTKRVILNFLRYNSFKYKAYYLGIAFELLITSGLKSTDFGSVETKIIRITIQKHD